MAAFDLNMEQDCAEPEKIISDGLNLFKDAFGFTSSSFIAPCYIWHPSIENTLKNFGIRYIQGLPIQYVPSYGADYKKIYHYQGEHNNIDQVYFIRNCFFEPAINPGFNWVEDCLRRMDIIFYWGKPAIVGTHRINFIGSLKEKNRTVNLNYFSVLLKKILDKWPDVEFTTTDKLGELY